MAAFLAIASQWRVLSGMGGIYFQGLDYAGAEAGLRLAGLMMTPALWGDVRLIEAGARTALNGGAK